MNAARTTTKAIRRSPTSYTVRRDSVIVATIVLVGDGWRVHPNNAVRRPSRHGYCTAQRAAAAHKLRVDEWHETAETLRDEAVAV